MPEKPLPWGRVLRAQARAPGLDWDWHRRQGWRLAHPLELGLAPGDFTQEVPVTFTQILSLLKNDPFIGLSWQQHQNRARDLKKKKSGHFQ